MFEKLAEELASSLGIDASSITMDSSFEDDLGADSLDLAELLFMLEDTYDLEFSSDELENFKTVGDVANYLRSKGIE